MKIEKYGPFVGAVILVVLIVAATLMTGCSLFESGPTEVVIKGESGADCTYDWECQSNACVYPGRCQ